MTTIDRLHLNSSFNSLNVIHYRDRISSLFVVISLNYPTQSAQGASLDEAIEILQNQLRQLVASSL